MVMAVAVTVGVIVIVVVVVRVFAHAFFSSANRVVPGRGALPPAACTIKDPGLFDYTAGVDPDAGVRP